MYTKFFKICIKKTSKHFFINNDLITLYSLRQSIFILKDQIKEKYLVCILRFFYNWFKIFFYLLTVNSNEQKKINLNFLINIQNTAIYNKKSANDFYNFIFKSSYKKIFNEDHFFIQGNFTYNINSQKFHKITDLNLFFIKALTKKQRMISIYYHFYSLIIFLIVGTLNSKFLYLYKDFSEYAIYKSLNNKKIKVFSHQNNFIHPFLCWKMAKRNNMFITYSMLYSMNSFPIEKNKLKNPYKFSNWKYFQLDFFLTWNKEHTNLMNKLNSKMIKIECGPILYYPDTTEIIKLKGKIKVLIFDVEPSIKYDDDTNNYYDYKTCSNFLIDIVSSFSNYFNKDVVLYLKRKDKGSVSLSHIHHEYTNLVNDFQRNNKKNFFLLNRNNNLFKIIQSVDIVIGIPFTSPIFIAKQKKKITFFYDLKNLPTFDTGINVINNKKELNHFVTNTLEKLQKRNSKN